MSTGSAKKPHFPEYRPAAHETELRPLDASSADLSDEMRAPAASQTEEAPPGVSVVADLPASQVRVVRVMNPWLLALCIVIPLVVMVFDQVNLARLQHRVDFTDEVALTRVRDAINQNKNLANGISQQISKLRAPMTPHASWEALTDLYGIGLKRSAEFRNIILDEFKLTNARGYYALLERQCHADPDKGIRDRADKDGQSHMGYLSECLFSDTKAVRLEGAADLEADYHSNVFALDCLIWANQRHPSSDIGLYNSLLVMERLDVKLLLARKEAVANLLARAKRSTNQRILTAAPLMEERMASPAGDSIPPPQNPPDFQ